MNFLCCGTACGPRHRDVADDAVDVTPLSPATPGSLCPLPYPQRFSACVAVAERLMPPEESVIAAAAGGGGDKVGHGPLSDVETRLRLYALKNQAEHGPCAELRPWPWDVVAHAKWSAWAELGDTSKFEAMRLYCKQVEQQVPNWWELEGAEPFFTGAEDGSDSMRALLSHSGVTTRQPVIDASRQATEGRGLVGLVGNCWCCCCGPM